MIAARIMPIEVLPGGELGRSLCLRCGATLTYPLHGGGRTGNCLECGLGLSLEAHCLLGAGDDEKENPENA